MAARLDRLAAAPAEARELSQSLLAAGVPWERLLVAICATVLLLSLLWLVLRHVVSPRSALPWRIAAADGLLVVLAIPLLALVGFTVPTVIEHHAIRIWGAATVLALIASDVIAAVVAGRRGERLDADGFARLVSIATAWALLGLALRATILSVLSGPGLIDAVGLFLVTLPSVAILCFAYERNRGAVSALIQRPDGTSALGRRVARLWPHIAVALILLSVLAVEIAASIGIKLSGILVVASVLFVLLAPHLDRRIADWAASGQAGASVAAGALRNTLRFGVMILAICGLGALWCLPLLAMLDIGARTATGTMLQLALIALVAAYLWNMVGALSRRVLTTADANDPSHAPTGGPATRLATVLPILSSAMKAGILSLALLTALVAIGVNAWPLLTGFSVFGLAIGFGSQSLVKDVVSGLFFLLDDAFRVGEYIETSGAKGTVERIAIRSLALRHPRGALATVPYGQIGKVTNFSRDWVIEKMTFRVAFDTDIDLVRRLFKKVGQDIAADPELAQDLLEPFKSQGIGAVEDGTLVIRAKFMARAGRQFQIRKTVLAAVQRVFRENGVVVVPKTPFSMSSGTGAIT